MKYAPEQFADFTENLEQRLKAFALRCVRVFRSLSTAYEAQHFGKQLVRSSSSAAANYRAVRRGRSQNEFFAKLSITIEELDESVFWLEMLIYADLIPSEKLSDLIDEGSQLLKILAASRKSVSRK